MKPSEILLPDEPPLDPARRPADLALLQKVQGNILKPHGRDFARLVLFQFPGVGADAMLREIFPAAVKAKLVTSAYQQWRDARDARPKKWREAHRPFYSLGLTKSGMDRCGYGFTEYPGPNTARFHTPMNDPLERSQLGDAPDINTRPDWESHYDDPHGVWLIANDSETELDQMERAVREFLGEHRAKAIHTERGFRWADDQGRSREPFGYVDGISTPEFFADQAYRQTPAWIRLPRTRVLLPDNDQAGDGQRQHAGGSFLVLRKLEQNVNAFRVFEARLKPQLKGAARCPFEPGALIVGRSREGVPLAELNRPGRGPNDFDFPADDARCPFHAHIRKANARSSTGAPSHDPETIRGVLFPRRGMVYDDNTPRRLPRIASGDYAEGAELGRESRVGLLFMGYMSSLGQFGTLQKEWFRDNRFPAANTNFNDPLLLGGASKYDWAWRGATMPRAMMDFVRPRGGAYFYVPSLPWLRAQSVPVAAASG
jgi:Dyp-type peroxidase family